DGGETGDRGVCAGVAEPRPARAFFRRAAGIDLCAGASRKRQAGARGQQVSLTPQTAAPSLRDVPWLVSGPAARVLGLLNRDGEEARVVGGAVRNALMNLPVTEVDIATTALPDAVVARARAASIKTIATGIEHGTVTLVIAGHPIEVTTLRQDVETYGRKAKVAFGR